MTTLTLAHKKLFPQPLLSFSWSLNGRFVGLSSGNLMRRVLLAAVILSAVSYLAALFISFSLGFQIQRRLTAGEELAKTVRAKELVRQQKMDLFAQDHVLMLESMEKVSAIRYLRPENVAISQSSLRP